MRAEALDRRFVADADLFAAGLAVEAFLAGALRVAAALRGAARFAAGREVAATGAEEPPLSSIHLPDSTRCAASATASAISEPNFEALVIIVVAA